MFRDTRIIRLRQCMWCHSCPTRFLDFLNLRKRTLLFHGTLMIMHHVRSWNCESVNAKWCEMFAVHIKHALAHSTSTHHRFFYADRIQDSILFVKYSTQCQQFKLIQPYFRCHRLPYDVVYLTTCASICTDVPMRADACFIWTRSVCV